MVNYTSAMKRPLAASMIHSIRDALRPTVPGSAMTRYPDFRRIPGEVGAQIRTLRFLISCLNCCLTIRGSCNCFPAIADSSGSEQKLKLWTYVTPGQKVVRLSKILNVSHVYERLQYKNSWSSSLCWEYQEFYPQRGQRVTVTKPHAES